MPDDVWVMIIAEFSKYQNKELILETIKLKWMIENGLGWKDMEDDITPMHEI